MIRNSQETSFNTFIQSYEDKEIFIWNSNFEVPLVGQTEGHTVQEQIGALTEHENVSVGTISDVFCIYYWKYTFEKTDKHWYDAH